MQNNTTEPCTQIHYNLFTNSQVNVCLRICHKACTKAKELGWNGKTQKSLDSAVEVLQSLSYFGLYNSVANAWQRIFEILSTDQDGELFDSLFMKYHYTRAGTVNQVLYKQIITDHRIKMTIEAADKRSNIPQASAGSKLLPTLGEERLAKLKAIQWADIYL